MGIIILLSVLLVVLITLTVIGWNYWDWDCSAISVLTIGLSIALGIALVICSIVCICTQVSKDTYIYEMEQDREALVESYNTYYNSYDKDLAHSQSQRQRSNKISLTQSSMTLCLLLTVGKPNFRLTETQKRVGKNLLRKRSWDIWRCFVIFAT